jgi:uncharacterized protein YdiU (UPF0061 family)
MASIFELNYLQNFQSLPSALYSSVSPQGLEDAILLLSSENTAQLLGLNTENLGQGDSLKLLAGQGVLSTWNPIAMKYTGHQFGHYNPDLGDGRGLLLAQVEHQGKQWDLHLKGAGLTPYSRQGDGRAVLRSSIREFLCSEAMVALGIPSSRVLSLVGSTTKVYREEVETGAMVMRVSESHIRFGHFEFCSFTGQHDLLKTLCDHVIEQHYPELKDSNTPYDDFFAITLDKTAKLVAHWQSIGFNHGVMNTDNMSIIGDTFDYGPFAFLDDYDANFICNHSDHQGRYAFSQQPNIANWNLAVLAQALLPLCEKENLVAKLDTFSTTFSNYYFEMMGKKLGFIKHGNEHKAFIEDTLTLLGNNRFDFTFFFRTLSSTHTHNSFEQLRNLALDIKGFDNWFKKYQTALLADTQNPEDDSQNQARQTRMNKTNPKYILRNYLAQNVISAAQNGDYTPLKELHQVLLTPFDEHPEFESFAQLPPDWGKKLEISCSS